MKRNNCADHRQCIQSAAFIAVLLLTIAGISCTTQKPEIPPLNTQALTTVLERGVSTTSDVRAALGEPNGVGAALIPTAEGRREVWFYERIKVELGVAAGGEQVEGNEIHQEVLMVFFEGDRFEGFLWFSSEEE